MEIIEDQDSLVTTIFHKFDQLSDDWKNIPDRILQLLVSNDYKTLKNPVFTKQSVVQVNGQMNFQMIVYNHQCTLIDSIKNTATDITGVKFFGIKIYDIFRIFWRKNDMIVNDFEFDHCGIAKKILKSNVLDDLNPVIGVTDKKGMIHLIGHKSKVNHDVTNFANHVVIFHQSAELYKLFLLSQSDNAKAKQKVMNELSTLIISISESTIKELLNIYYFNNTKPRAQTEDIVFDQPKSLIDIMQEYHSSSPQYHVLKKNIKPNENPMMIFDNVNSFAGKNSKIVKLNEFGNLYFRTWNEDDRTIFRIIDSKMKEKRKVNDKRRFRDISYDDRTARLGKQELRKYVKESVADEY
jgi:hypothetical protein